MTTQVQLRRGDTDQNDSFIGAEAEMTVVTDDWSLRVHDGVTPGGHPVGGGGGGGGGFAPFIARYGYMNTDELPNIKTTFMAGMTEFTPAHFHDVTFEPGGIWNIQVNPDPVVEFDDSDGVFRFDPLADENFEPGITLVYRVDVTTSIETAAWEMDNALEGPVLYGTKLYLSSDYYSVPGQASAYFIGTNKDSAARRHFVNYPAIIPRDDDEDEYHADDISGNYNTFLSETRANLSWTDTYFLRLSTKATMDLRWAGICKQKPALELDSFESSVTIQRISEYAVQQT